MSDNRQKIAVIGGGVGAITTTDAITTIPDWKTHHDMALYQLGRRCGGKGGPGRCADRHDRIKEHGLHIWVGFYENAFRLMRDCCLTLNNTGLRSPDAPLGMPEKAFKGLGHFFLAKDLPQPDGTVSLHPWRVDFGPNSDLTGSGACFQPPSPIFRCWRARLPTASTGAPPSLEPRRPRSA